MSWIKNMLGMKPTQEEFARLAFKVCQTAYEGQQIILDKKEFSLVVCDEEGKPSNTIYLGNAYEEYCAAPKDVRDLVLRSLFEKPVELPDSLNDAIVNIMPRVQPRSFFEENIVRARLSPISEDDSFQLPYQPIAEHLAIGLVWDTPQQVAYLSEETLTKWETSFESLLPRAITNLTRISPEPFQPAGKGVYISHYQDTHDASRLLITHRIKDCRVKGRPLACIPNRNTLIITGDEDVEGQTTALKLIEQALKQPRMMPVFPIVMENDRWQLWNVPPADPNGSTWAELNVMALTDIYGQQQELLNALNEVEESEVFVATYTAMRAPAGEVISFSTWTEGTHSWLPKTDLLTFVEIVGDDGDVVCCVKWDDARQILGNELRELDVYPKRFEVKGFPSAAQLSELKKCQAIPD